MKHRVVQASLVACLLALGWLVGQVMPIEAVAQQMRSTVPKSYGAFRGAIGGDLLFEDSAGTIRVVYTNGNLGAEIARR
jgi:hypothetical protein